MINTNFLNFLKNNLEFALCPGGSCIADFYKKKKMRVEG